ALKTGTAGGNIRLLQIDTLNSGVLDISGADTRVDAGNYLTDTATMTIEVTGTLTARSGRTFVGQGGSLANNGGFEVFQATLNQGGTNGSGHAVSVVQSSL